MLLHQIPSVRVFAEWPWLSQCDEPNLLQRLIDQTAFAYRIEGTDAGLVLSAGRATDNGKIALWVVSLFGSVGLRPKANRDLMRRVLAEVSELARDADCEEVRIERGDRFDWKLRLLPDMGFERLDVGGKFVMRKAI